MKKTIVSLFTLAFVAVTGSSYAKTVTFDELISNSAVAASFDTKNDQILFPVVDSTTHTYKAGSVNFQLRSKGSSYPLILKFSDNMLHFKIDNGEDAKPRFQTLGTASIPQGNIHYMTDKRGLLFMFR